MRQVNVRLAGIGAVLVVAGAVTILGRGTTQAAEGDGQLLAHNVYFSLKDNTPAARSKLVGACKKYLADHPGVVFFAAGTRAEEFKRDVNDRDFDVALHIVFKDKASHDKYQDAPTHLKFIEENKDNWAKVRVLDSYVGK